MFHFQFKHRLQRNTEWLLMRKWMENGLSQDLYLRMHEPNEGLSNILKRMSLLHASNSI